MNLYKGKFQLWTEEELKEHGERFVFFGSRDSCVACSGTGIVRVTKKHRLNNDLYVDPLDCPFCEGAD